jgi:hypothetical protein
MEDQNIYTTRKSLRERVLERAEVLCKELRKQARQEVDKIPLKEVRAGFWGEDSADWILNKAAKQAREETLGVNLY